MLDELLTIGRFARLCRLSVKQLRHYDETGLLRPARVDPATGYRHYARTQARDALTVALLRDLDLPLPVIADVLAAQGAERADILRGERDRLAARIERDRVRLGLLDRLADDRQHRHEVELAREPALRLAVLRATCGPADLGARTGDLVGRLLAAAGRARTPWTPPLRGLFPLDLADGMSVAVGIDIGAGPPPEETSVEILGEGPVVATVHIGPYAELPLAYNALFAWVHERGLRPVPPVREEYLVSPGEADADELMTRISIPIADLPKETV
ncbi:MerR family transcriptional regulator [Solihabitans fulvus]|uniref:MerR family transcriptional regulator n=1 Tax=Solihabitans fulvus TaxID=1892852 RepID=A0A5B2XBP2_9PSEU|nr:MerR family transcriptional regulator [Solihabitans fulvus]KAA2261148.1 MerR family transcriptional regulator [Solihabitans fulvus]